MLKKRLPGWLVGEPIGIEDFEIGEVKPEAEEQILPPEINGVAPVAEAEEDEPVTEESLRAAYDAAVRETALMPPANPYSQVADLFDTKAASKPPSASHKFLKRPWLAGSIAACFCIAASATYMGLGYWFLSSINPESVASESFAMLDVHEAGQIHNDTQHLLRNIQELERHGTAAQASGEESRPELVASALPAVADEKPASVKTEGFNLLALGSELPELVGRADPFSPLVQPNGAVAVEARQGEVDILQDVRYTGFIGDVNSKDKVAIIRVADDQALIKKVGESFTVEGNRVIVKSIGKNAIQLKVSGQTRSLPLQAYAETLSASSASASGTGYSNASAGTGTSSSGGTAEGTTGAPSGSTAKTGSSPASPSLQEPQ